MVLFATVAYYGNKNLGEVLEIRLTIHDEFEEIVHTEYWNVKDRLTEDDVTNDIIKTCERFGVQQIFTIDKVLEPEYCEECDERIFRTTRIRNLPKKKRNKKEKRSKRRK